MVSRQRAGWKEVPSALRMLKKARQKARPFSVSALLNRR
jgi:hypothetical protein